ncbi:hypothetical protein ASPZODRAFT_22632 [Penicilliopsis zonata CBS 506.65]|uniref:BRCT domain-containing protein n=1 Tax=Penicilliopsis zonata CBS 506.65 TaxID=1073090 RepID=A0A1L9SRU6_9EURO|nr:hypothetical protein ASPZODRAFT_22632 [Penicilliopsis zonata CBS 506.65]OJJ49922.1 hypothetical protein ASPZODRAFT_22632 [Penicilliopsis zonata CBS 506.65]
MGKPFSQITASSVGSFGDNGDKIPQWIRANGGFYSRDISEGTTHLIATKEAFKRNVEAVQQAKQHKVKIVSYEWLEDSLLSKSRRPKREGPYLLEKILKMTEKKKRAGKVAKAKKAKRAAMKRQGAMANADDLESFVEECLGVKARTEARNYHLYADQQTGLAFSATVVRPTIKAKSREKFQMQIFESNTEPHVYAAYARYSRVGKSSAELLAPPGSSLDFTLTVFTKFFTLKTGKTWDKRFDGKYPPRKTDEEGNILPAHEGWYEYEPRMGLLASFLRQTCVGGQGNASCLEPDMEQQDETRPDDSQASGLGDVLDDDADADDDIVDRGH